MQREEGGDEYNVMLLLDRLETMLEDMDELGVRSREEIITRIAELHRQLDERES